MKVEFPRKPITDHRTPSRLKVGQELALGDNTYLHYGGLHGGYRLRLGSLLGNTFTIRFYRHIYRVGDGRWVGRDYRAKTRCEYSFYGNSAIVDGTARFTKLKDAIKHGIGVLRQADAAARLGAAL